MTTGFQSNAFQADAFQIDAIVPGVGVYPDPSDVRIGVMYGPTGVEYTGTAPANRLKRWTGSAWETNGLRSWNGTAWM